MQAQPRKPQDTLAPMLLEIEKEIQSGNLQKAATGLNRLRPLYIDDARIYVTGWLLAEAANNHAAGLRAAEHATQLDPNSMTARYCLACSQARLNMFEEAEQNIETVLKYYPTHQRYLQLAEEIAIKLGKESTAEQHLRTALAQPNAFPGAQAMLGNSLMRQGKYEEADLHLNAAFEKNNRDHIAAYGLAMRAYSQGNTETALKYINIALAVIPSDPTFRFYADVFSGKTPAQQPNDVMTGLFDSYASSFDAHLVGQLGYRLPAVVASKITERYPDRKLNLLDLGCGTGLLGAALGRIDGYLVGVDLSLPMLAQAEKRGVYARLHNVNLLDALAATDANEYEVITALEVFIYMGELSTAFTQAHKVLRPEGWLMFSIEIAENNNDAYQLENSLRYSHSPALIKNQLEAAGYRNISSESFDLRRDQDAMLKGMLFIAQK